MEEPTRRQVSSSSLDRIKALEAVAEENVERQHVTSRVILKRFEGDSNSRFRGSIGIVNLDRPLSKPLHRGRGGCGFVKNYVKFASKSLEEIWGRIETKLGGAIDACLENPALGDDQAGVLRDTMALHFARSVYTPEMLDRLWDQNMFEMCERLVKEHPDWLRAEFRNHFSGQEPRNDDDLRRIFSVGAQSMVALKERGAFLRDSLESIFEKARAQLSGLHLETFYSPQELVIGDAPLIARARDGRIGFLNGVALGDADIIAMPLDPHLLVSMAFSPATGQLTPHQTDVMNGFQIEAARSQVYFRLDGPRLQFIRDHPRNGDKN